MPAPRILCRGGPSESLCPVLLPTECLHLDIPYVPRFQMSKTDFIISILSAFRIFFCPVYLWVSASPSTQIPNKKQGSLSLPHLGIQLFTRNIYCFYPQSPPLSCVPMVAVPPHSSTVGSPLLCPSTPLLNLPFWILRLSIVSPKVRCIAPSQSCPSLPLWPSLNQSPFLLSPFPQDSAKFQFISVC